MIVYKDILERLAANGWSAYRLAKEHVLGNSSIQRIRDQAPISTETIGIICKLLKCQPGDILEYVPDQKGEE